MHFENREYVNSAKGVLILLVVLGHSVLASEYAGLKTFVYSFHVYAFLLLPFILSGKTATWENLLNTAARYLVPYLAIVFLMSILYGWLQGYSMWQWFRFYIRGVATGNDNFLKATSGFHLFWFFPVLFWVSILLQIYNRADPRVKVLLFVVFSVAHLLLPSMSWEQKQYYPYCGTHIAVYIMPVGLLLRYLCRRMTFVSCRRARLLWSLGFALLVVGMLAQGSELSLAHLGCPSYKSPLRVATHAFIPMFAMLVLIGFSRDLSRVRYLVIAGQKSVCIYLFSQPAVWLTTIVLENRLGFDGRLSTLLCGSLSVILGIAFGCAVAFTIEMLPTLRALLFPRSYPEFLAVMGKHARLLSRVFPSRSEQTWHV